MDMEKAKDDAELGSLIDLVDIGLLRDRVTYRTVAVFCNGERSISVDIDVDRVYEDRLRGGREKEVWSRLNMLGVN